MTKKVKLTREQARIVEDLKGNHKGLKDLIYKDTCMDWAHPHFHKMSDETLAIALYTDVGYEVEESFEIGDWVVRTVDMGRNHELGKIFKIEEINGEDVCGEEGPSHIKSSIRHATPEEITKEKQRRWWAKHGREVWQLKRHDVLKSSAGNSFEVSGFHGSGERQKVIFGPGHFDHMSIVKESYKVICFAEDRKDIEQ